MKHNKTSIFFKKFFKYTMFFINIVAISVLVFLFIALYFIVFEVRIPYLASKVVSGIKKDNKDYIDKNNIDFNIQGIAIAWDYKINRPIILLEEVAYKDPINSVNLDKLGFYIDLKSFFVNNNFEILNIYSYNINILIENKNNNYFFKSSNFQRDNSAISKNKGSDSETINYQDLYSLIMDNKEKYHVIKRLNEVNFYDAKIVVANKIDTFEFMIPNLNIQGKKDIIFEGNIFILKNVSQNLGNIDFLGSLSKTNTAILDVNFNAVRLDKFKPLLDTWLGKFDVYKDLSINGVPISGNLYSEYSVKEGINDIKLDIKGEKGSLSYKSVLDSPLMIDSLSAKLGYDKNNKTLTIDFFEAMFQKDNIVANKATGFAIPVSLFKTSGHYSINNGSFNLSNLFIVAAGRNIYGDIKLNKNLFSLNAEIKEEFNLKNLNSLWSKNFAKETRTWVFNNIHSSTIKNTNFKLLMEVKNNGKFAVKEISALAKLSNVNMTYLEGMPLAQSNDVTLVYDANLFKIIYNNAKTGDLTSESGVLTFYDYSPKENYQAGLMLNLKVEGGVKEAIKFIDNKPLNLASTNNIGLDIFNGNVKGNIDILYAFDSGIRDIKLKLALTNLSYKNAFQGYDAYSGQATLDITNDKLYLLGDIFYLDSPAKAEINVPFDEGSSSTYQITFDKFSTDSIKKLNILPENIISLINGNTKVNVEYANIKGKADIKFSVDLKDTNVVIPQFSYEKPVNGNLLVTGALSLIDNKPSEIRALSILGSGLNIEMDMNFYEKFNQIIINTARIGNKVNVYGNITYNEKDFNLVLKGSELEISSLLAYYRPKPDRSNGAISSTNNSLVKSLNEDTSQGLKNAKVDATPIVPGNSNIANTQNQSQESDLKTTNYNITLDVKNIRNNKLKATNTEAKIQIEQGNIKAINVTSYFDSKKKSTIVFDDVTRILGLNIYNFGAMLRMLDLSQEISGGDLDGNVSLYHEIRNGERFFITDGEILVHNFSTGVDFSSAVLAFKGTNGYFTIEELALSGNILGGKLIGYFDYNTQYLSLEGKLIPIWGTNTLIANSPILGNILKDILGKEQGALIDFNFYISGAINDLKVSYFRNKVNAAQSIPAINAKDVNTNTAVDLLNEKKENPNNTSFSNNPDGSTTELNINKNVQSSAQAAEEKESAKSLDDNNNEVNVKENNKKNIINGLASDITNDVTNVTKGIINSVTKYFK